MNSGRGLKASPDSYGEFGYADEIQHFQSPDAAIALISRERSDAVTVDASLPIKRAAELALDYRIPSACAYRLFWACVELQA
jgi:hypothetical protein